VEGSDLAFLRALAETRSFTNGRPQSVTLTPDGSTALFLRALPRKAELRLYAFDLATGTERELASPETVLGARGEQLSPEEKARRERMRISARGIVGYELSKDGRQVLFTLGGRAFVVSITGEGLREVAGPGPQGEPLFDPHLSPDGQRLGFLRGGELHVQSLVDGEAKAVTAGATALVTHARAEYVAQEELSRFRGWWWSPDSTQLLYEEVDNRGVEQLWLQDPASMFKPVEPVAYPRPGKPNAKIRFGLVPAAGGATTWIDHHPATWEYVSRVFWDEGGPLCFVAVTRAQDELVLLAVEATGQTRELLHEKDAPFLNPERELRWLQDGGFLWNSERGGAWQLWRHGATGEAIGPLTAPRAGFVRTLGLDEARGVAWVQTAPSPVTEAVAEVSLDPRAARLTVLAPPEGDGSANVAAVFSKQSAARVVTVHGLHGAPRSLAVRADGTLAGALRSIAEEAPFEPRLALQQVGAPLVGGKPAEDGGFWTALVRPRDFDPAKKYPVLLQVYGGPHALTVRPNASAYLTDQWIADHGFLVVHADNRGTPLRGRDWEREIAGRFGEVPLEDQVAALQALAAQEPALDLGRVGVIGHSYGGFLATRAVLLRPDVFKAAVAGAPVVDWRNYDSTYTERYLGIPPPLGQSAVFEENGLLAHAARLSRPLLLVHGTADDNVHFSESLLLGDALFRAGRPFELLPQVGQTHMFSQPDLQVRYWERVFAFFRAHL
jgi:dipeptidyl-peptidase-4